MIYQRLTVRSCARYAAVIAPVVTFISGLIFFSRLLGDTVSGVIPPFILGKLFILTLLKYAPQLLILSAFAGTFIAMRRAFIQNEMHAWFNSGLGLHNFIKPVLVFALPTAIVVGIFSLWVSPWAVYSIGTVRTAAAFDITLDHIIPEQFGVMPGGTHSYYLNKNNTLFVADNQHPSVIFARGLTREDNSSLRFLDGDLFHLRQEENGSQSLEKMRFASLRLSLPDIEKINIRPRAKTLAALDWDKNNDRAELIWRLMLPLALIILVLSALLLSPAHSRVGRQFGFFSAITVFFLYLNALRFMRDQVAGETLPAAAAIILPPLATALLIFLLDAIRRRR